METSMCGVTQICLCFTVPVYPPSLTKIYPVYVRGSQTFSVCGLLVVLINFFMVP